MKVYFIFLSWLLISCNPQAVPSLPVLSDLTLQSVRIMNESTEDILVPLSEGAIAVSGSAKFEVVKCEATQYEIVSENLLMFTTLDTLHSGHSKTYTLNLLQGGIVARYDSQLVHILPYYQSTLFAEEPYSEESTRTLSLITYRHKGRIEVGSVQTTRRPEATSDFMNFRICPAQ